MWRRSKKVLRAWERRCKSPILIKPYNKIMTIKIMLVLSVMAAAVMSSAALAGNDYRCTIERVIDSIEDNSSSITVKKKMYIGKEFTVDRRTGVMAGALKNAYLTEPRVIDSGSNENSFKAVTAMRKDQGVGAGSNLFAIVVKEYSESSKKPFVFLENDTVFYGHCSHF
jgi:hypothetical protein